MYIYIYPRNKYKKNFNMNLAKVSNMAVFIKSKPTAIKFKCCNQMIHWVLLEKQMFPSKEDPCFSKISKPA